MIKTKPKGREMVHLIADFERDFFAIKNMTTEDIVKYNEPITNVDPSGFYGSEPKEEPKASLDVECLKVDQKS